MLRLPQSKALLGSEDSPCGGQVEAELGVAPQDMRRSRGIGVGQPSHGRDLRLQLRETPFSH